MGNCQKPSEEMERTGNKRNGSACAYMPARYQTD